MLVKLTQMDIPLCANNLPDVVDLSILDYMPRQCQKYVSHSLIHISLAYQIPNLKDILILGWMEQDHEEFLIKLIHLEGQCRFETCTVCKAHLATYCCHDYLTLDLFCKDCILSRHASNAQRSSVMLDSTGNK